MYYPDEDKTGNERAWDDVPARGHHPDEGPLHTPPRGTHDVGRSDGVYNPDNEAAVRHGGVGRRVDDAVTGLGMRVAARAGGLDEADATSVYMYAAIALLVGLLLIALVVTFLVKKILWLAIASAAIFPGVLLVATYSRMYPSSAGRTNANAQVFLAAMAASLPTTAFQFGGTVVAMVLSSKVDDPNKTSLHPAVLVFFAVLYIVTSYVILSPIYLLLRRAASQFGDGMEVVIHGLFAGLGFAALENVIWIVLMSLSPFELPAPSSFIMQICRAVLYVPILGVCGLMIGARVAREHFLYEKESLMRAIFTPVLILWTYSFLPVLASGPWVPWFLIAVVVIIDIMGFVYLHKSLLPPLVGHRFEAI